MVQHVPKQQPVLAINANSYETTASKDLTSPLGGPESGQLLPYSENNVDVPNNTFEFPDSVMDDFLDPNARANLSSRPEFVQTTDETGGICQPTNGVPPTYFAQIYNSQLWPDDSGFRPEDVSLSTTEFGQFKIVLTKLWLDICIDMTVCRKSIGSP